MARCGCTSTCSCATVGTDTTTIDMTVNGNGAAGTPYDVSGIVILVPDSTGPLSGENPLKEDALGLYVDLDVESTPGVRVVKEDISDEYNPILSDIDKLVTLDNAGPIDLILPQDSDVAFPIGAEIHFAQLGAGQVTAVAGTGATVLGTPGLLFRDQYSYVIAIKLAADTWLLRGDLDV